MNASAVPVATLARSDPPAHADGAASVAGAKPREGTGSVALYLGPGQHIADRYEVVEVVGEGGMGVVYSCRDRAGELCAVKRVVLPESNPSEHLAWFMAEAQALAALNHRNVVRARDFGQLRDGTPYLVMDLVEGVLWQQISIEPANFPLIWTIVDQLLAALAHAHARGIVHGDLKPSNVVVDLDERGEPRARLFDFGLAKRRRSELDPRLVPGTSVVEPPSSAGTQGYMAPEQILGRSSEISGATDLYALGCILYRVLAGRPLALRDSRKDLDFHSFEEPARPPPLPGVSEALVDFVLSLLVLKPWRRVCSALAARKSWQSFRPSEPCAARAALRDLLARGRELREELAPTRRIGPLPSRGSHAKLARSRKWLPGLLSVRRSPLIGRSEQQRMLRELCARLGEPGQSRQRAVLLTGPAGVGKSRLADWLCTEVEERGTAHALRGFRHASHGGRDPLAMALLDRFAIGRGALRLLPSSVSDHCGEDDVGAVVDWVLRSQRPSVFDNAEGESLAPRLLRVLDAVAQGGPLVLWLDDIAAVSSATWATLLAARELAPNLRFLAVMTARAEHLAKPTILNPLRVLRAALPTEFLRVPALDSLTTSALLRATYPLDSARALQIALDSRGVPLEALSRLYACARRGRL